MKKTRKVLLLLLVSLLIFSVAMFAVACKEPIDEDNTPVTEEEEETIVTDLVSNGNFGKASVSDKSNAYVKDTVTGWTLTKGSFATTTSGLVAGAIDLDQTKFDAGKSQVDDKFTANPGIAPHSAKQDGAYVDTNALCLVIPDTTTFAAYNGGSIFYKSSSVTVAKDKYYKLSVDVYTDIFTSYYEQKQLSTDKRGAAIVITNGVYTEFISINTDKTWQSYTVYIEGNNYENRTFYIELWLGYGPKEIGNAGTYSDYSTLGIALFDNAVMTEITEEAYGATTDKIAAAGYQTENNIRITSASTEETKALADKDADQNVIYGGVKAVSLLFADPLLSQYSPSTSLTSSASTYKTFNSAKVGPVKNYTFYTGGKKVSDTDDFPAYSATSTSSSNPIGIFDMSKLAAYNTIYTTGFSAPSAGNFYNGAALAGVDANGQAITKPYVDSTNRGIMIYHMSNAISGAGYVSSGAVKIDKDTYYKISVWVYVWVPEFYTSDDVTPVEGDSDYDAYLEYLKYFDGSKSVKATFRLSGSSIGVEESDLEVTSNVREQWQQLSIYVKGSELTSRNVNLEFWYGEGEWGSDTLYPGGCFFDDVTINAYSAEAVAADVNLSAKSWVELSPIADADFSASGLYDNNIAGTEFTSLDDIANGWSSEAADPAHTAEGVIKSGILSGVYLKDGTGYAGYAGIAKDALPAGTPFSINNQIQDLFVLNNTDYTASTAKFDVRESAKYETGGDAYANFMKVYKNNFYRLSMWVYTGGIDSGLGATVAVYTAETDSSLVSISTLNVSEWTELVFVFKGTTTEAQQLYINITLGTGDVYTPASHVKGFLILTALTWQEVDYNDYSGVTTGAYLKQTALTSSDTESNTVGNGTFININTNNYSSKEVIFDKDGTSGEKGNIIGVAAPSSDWTASTANALTAPDISVSANKITWTHVLYSTAYYIYMDGWYDIGSSDPDPATENMVLVSVMDATGFAKNDKCTYTATYNATYYVRAFAAITEASDTIYVCSDYDSGTVSSVADADEVMPAKWSAAHFDLIGKSGIINYKYYTGLYDDDKSVTDYAAMTEAERQTSFYGAASLGKYVSVNSANLLMISSEISMVKGYYMASSKSLSTSSFYKVSVWVKTVGGAKAAVTIKNTSNAIAYTSTGTDAGEYVGFVDIDTQGEWKQVVFYIKTNLTTGSMILELNLGNKYAVNNENEDALSYSKGLSKGTVYFDDIYFNTLADEEVYGLETGVTYTVGDEQLPAANSGVWVKLSDTVKETGSLYTNEYRFITIDYTTDTFDSFTASKEKYLGGEPASYTHGVATGGSGYLAPDEEEEQNELNMIYGVFSTSKAAAGKYDDIINYMTGIGLSAEEIKDFMSEVGTGSNYYLMLANLISNGQDYTSGTYSFAADSYYKITFRAKLFLAEDSIAKYAEFRFIPGNDTTTNTSIRIYPGEEMAEYTFYCHNDSAAAVSSNVFEFHLGTNDSGDKNFAEGMLIIDDVTVIVLDDATDYETAVNELKLLSAEELLASATKTYLFEEAETPAAEEPEEEEGPKGSKTTSTFWLMVSSIVIGAIILVVIIIFAVRKVKERLPKKPVKVDSKVEVNPDKVKKPKGEARKADIADDEEFKD